MVDTHKQSLRWKKELDRLQQGNSAANFSPLVTKIKNHSFVTADFNRAELWLKNLLALDPVLVGKHVVRERKPKPKISAQIVWMRAQTSQVSFLSEKIISPVSLHLEMGRKNLFFNERPLPFIFDYDHLEFRVIEKLGVELNYNTDDFRQSLKIGLVLSACLGPKMKEQNQGGMPIFLPHKNGLFAGFSARQEDSSYFPLAYLKAAFKKVATDPIRHSTLNDKYRPPWSTATPLVIKTFMPTVDLTKTKEKLYDRMSYLLTDVSFNERINRIYNSYVSCTVLTDGIEDDIIQVSEALSVIIEGKEWQEAIKSRVEKVDKIIQKNLKKTQPN